MGILHSEILRFWDSAMETPTEYLLCTYTCKTVSAMLAFVGTRGLRVILTVKINFVRLSLSYGHMTTT
jgi:hypothetical protein